MNTAEPILGYLELRMPGYPFDQKLDHEFVNELINDFCNVDILEQTKAFRWYHDNDPAAKYSNLRIALRRWLTNAWARERNPTS